MELVLFIMCFCIVYLVYYVVVIKRKKKLDKLVNSTECKFLQVKYNIDVTKIPIKVLANHLALINALIISIAASIISINIFKTNVMLQWLIKFIAGIVILVPLILITYNFLGKYYQKNYQGGNKNV